jgi:homoserine dehydrogenase
MANNIEGMYGIVNGTCNYILTNMIAKGQEFADALQQAQQKGFAEADPTLDINGDDSAHKLTILASIAFGYEIKLEDIYVEGIESISRDDLRFGSELGYKLKLLAIGKREENGKVSLRVHPSFIAEDNELAKVDGSFNAVSVFGSAVGQVMFYGRGAGMMPTASAVVADIVDVALGNSATIFRHLNLKPRAEVEPLIEKIENFASRFYIRFMAKDQPGVFAHIGKILADNQVSISGVLQHEGRGADNTVPLVITTHPTLQSKVNACLQGLRDVDTVVSEPVCIRIVDIPEDKD